MEMESLSVPIDDAFLNANVTEYVFQTPQQLNVDLCRLCLNLAKLHPIEHLKFTKKRDNFQFLEVELEFSLPSRVCKSCLEKLNEILLFIKICKESYELYTKMQENTILKKEQVVTEEESHIIEEIQVRIQDDNEADSDSLDADVSNSCNGDLENPIREEVETENKTNSSVIEDEKIEEQCKKTDKSKSSVINDEQIVEQPVIETENKTVSLFIEDEKEEEQCKTIKRKRAGQKICPKCGECVSTLVAHYKQKFSCKPSNYKCEHCNLYCNSKYYLNVHLESKHEDKAFMCDICSKIMKNPQSLQRHIREHTNGKQFVCDICAKGFLRHEYLVDHRNVHAELKPFSCSICTRRFTTNKALHLHRKKHVNPQTSEIVRKKRELKHKDVVCDICNRRFTLPRSLKQHMRCHREKSNKKPSFCKICSKSFDGAVLFRQHMSSEHAENEFICDQCGKRCINQGRLRIHYLTHKEPSVSCTFCDRKFRLTSHLNRHLNLIHNVNKGDPFKCNICSKKFNLKGNLVVHMRVHTGEKPYSCHVCNKKFSFSTDRKRHIVKIHGAGELENIKK